MNAIRTIIDLYVLVLIARIILEWIPISYGHPLERVKRGLRAVTDPVLIPLRRVIPPIRAGGMAIDLSPLILIIGLQLLSRNL
ncbi:MAG: YggT family protein [Acidimicrobiia bacterium]|nr:YggT family protein [Acidimicrobiia bacterium]